MGTNNVFSTEVSIRGMKNILGLGLIFSSSLLNSTRTKFVGFAGSRHKCKED